MPDDTIHVRYPDATLSTPRLDDHGRRLFAALFGPLGPVDGAYAYRALGSLVDDVNAARADRGAGRPSVAPVDVYASVLRTMSDPAAWSPPGWHDPARTVLDVVEAVRSVILDDPELAAIVDRKRRTVADLLGGAA